MSFPSFGDAEAYAQLGRACAEAIAGPGSAFDACYHPVRPVGITLLMTAPYLATADPVDADYIMLALNVAFFTVVVACLAAVLMGDRALLAGRPRRQAWLAAAAFGALLPNLVPHIPVRLGDLPSLAAFMGALLVAARTVRGPWTGRALLGRYVACGALCALAVLLRVTYVPYSVFLLGSLLLLDGNARGARLRCALAFAAGMAPVSIQAVNVLLHSGHIGLYDAEYMRRYFPHREHGIEAVFATIPERTAYMVQATGGTSRLEVLVMRLFRGLFGFEWAIYHGAPVRARIWNPGTGEVARASALVLAYLAAAAWAFRKGTPGLKLLTLNAAAQALFMAVLVHTELRYYAFPRSVLWLTAAVGLLAAFPRRGDGSSSAPPTP